MTSTGKARASDHDPVASHRVHRVRLRNGLHLLVVPQIHLHTAHVSVFVRVGSRYESPRDNGISHFLEHMLFRGNRRYPTAYELNWMVESLGGTLNASTYVDFTELELSLPPEHVEQGIALMADVLHGPTFRDVAVEQSVVCEEILETLDERGRDVDLDNIARRHIFGAHPLGQKIAGSARNVRRFTEADLQRHMGRYYVGSNMVVVVSGAVRVERVAQVARKHLQTLPAGRPARRVRAPRVTPGPRVAIADGGGSQANVRISWLTFGEADSDAQVLRLLTRVLDDGMSTRLHRHICDQRGLAYNVFASLDMYRDCGVLDVGATVEHSKTPLVVAELLAVLYELTRTPITQQELDKALARYRWDLRASLDEPDVLAHHYGTLALHGQDGSLALLAKRAAMMTPARLQAVARKILKPTRMFVACTGDLPPAERRHIRRVIAAAR